MAFDRLVARRRRLARGGMVVICAVAVLALLAAAPARPDDWVAHVRQEPGAAVRDFLDVLGVRAEGCEFFEVSRHLDRKGRRLIVFAESSRGRSGCDVGIVSVTVDGGAVLLEVHKKVDGVR